jgi:hypothetical protein
MLSEEEHIPINVKGSFLDKLKSFNRMASETIKKNNLKGKESLTTRITIIKNSFKLFDTIRLQQRILGISVVGLIRIAKIQKVLNEAGVAYTFPGIPNIIGPSPMAGTDADKEAKMEQALKKMDVSKMPKN